MAEATKIIKVPGGDAFIEVGESYVRFGVGSETSFVLDRSSMTADADSFNMQMSPNKITYQGILKNTEVIPGLLPIGPKYLLDLKIAQPLANVARSMAEVAKATSIGIV